MPDNVGEDRLRISSALEDFNEGLIKHCNDLMISKVNNGAELLDLNDETKRNYIDSAKKWNNNDIIRICKVLHDMFYSLKNLKHPMIFFEMTSLKLMEMDIILIILFFIIIIKMKIQHLTLS